MRYQPLKFSAPSYALHRKDYPPKLTQCTIDTSIYHQPESWSDWGTALIRGWPDKTLPSFGTVAVMDNPEITPSILSFYYFLYFKVRKMEKIGKHHQRTLLSLTVPKLGGVLYAQSPIGHLLQSLQDSGWWYILVSIVHCVSLGQ